MIALVFLLFALFALAFPLGSIAVTYTTPAFAVGLRMLCSGLLMLAWYGYRNCTIRLKRTEIPALLLLALLGIYVTNVLELWALQYLTAAKTCFIYSLSPFITALLSYGAFGERLNKRQWIGIVVGIAGFVPMLVVATMHEARSGMAFGFFSWAELAMIGAATATVFGWMGMKKLTQQSISPILANGYAMTVGGAIALGHTYLFGSHTGVLVTSWWPFIRIMFAMALISNFICYNLYGYLLRRYSATFMALAGLSTPIFAVLFGWLLLGQTVEWPFWLALAMVSCGLWLFHKK
jgi:drug/metabolite transporter (DMT)-like permease